MRSNKVIGTAHMVSIYGLKYNVIFKDVEMSRTTTTTTNQQQMQWNTEYAIQRVSKTKPRPNPRRDNKELMKMRKKLETAKDQTEKIHLKDRIRIIREHSYNN